MHGLIDIIYAGIQMKHAPDCLPLQFQGAENQKSLLTHKIIGYHPKKKKSEGYRVLTLTLQLGYHAEDTKTNNRLDVDGFLAIHGSCVAHCTHGPHVDRPPHKSYIC